MQSLNKKQQQLQSLLLLLLLLLLLGEINLRISSVVENKEKTEPVDH